jgi:hypothetical protein
MWKNRTHLKQRDLYKIHDMLAFIEKGKLGLLGYNLRICQAGVTEDIFRRKPEVSEGSKGPD